MRITIDLDSPSNLDIQRCYYNLWHITKAKPFIRLSSGKKGVHIKVHGVRGISEDELVKIREELGDDSVRIKFDNERIAKPKQVLWTVKNGKKAGNWCSDVDYIICEISKMRCI